MSRRNLGIWGERVAEANLLSLGYTFVARNYRSQEGEIDLILSDGETLIFVEVRTRASSSFGSPEESLTKRKRRRLHRAALAYMDSKGIVDAMWRIDVVAIEGSPSSGVRRFDHYENAVQGREGF